MAVRAYTELIAWQKGMDLAAEIYHATADFPKEETYGLRAQLRRAAVSIPSNIAEGQGRGAGADFVRFLGMARGSLFELETQILLAERLGFLSTDVCNLLVSLTAELGRLLSGLIRSVTEARSS